MIKKKIYVLEIRKITGVVKKIGGDTMKIGRHAGPWKRPWYKFLLRVCVCVAWVEKLRTSLFNFAPVPIRLESVGDSRPTLVTAFNLNSQEFNLVDYLWGSANWFHSSSEIFLLWIFLLCVAIGGEEKKEKRKCKKGARFYFCNAMDFWCGVWLRLSDIVWFLFWYKRRRERERERDRKQEYFWTNWKLEFPCE